MSTYISSNANRFYVAVEASFSQAAPITAGQRFPAVRLRAHQAIEIQKRLDKTGTRTYLGSPAGARRITAFEVQTYLASWNGSSNLSCGPLFQAALGGSPNLSAGLTIGGTQGPLQLQTSTPHGLSTGSAVAYGNEIRFIATVLDSQNFQINAPFRTTPQAGAPLDPALTFPLSSAALPSISVYDFWDPVTAVSRLLVGAAVDLLDISINGDFHEFTFSGPAGDLLDSASFVAGSGGLETFPAEPALATFDYDIVPGHLGEAWLGGPANQFFTLTEAAVQIKNNLEKRDREYGSIYPRAISAGQREVASRFALLAQDDAQTIALYAASKGRIPTPAMIQLGQQQGRLMGILMPQVVPEIPVYNDTKPRLQWEFNNNIAQGTSDDEIFIAFA